MLTEPPALPVKPLPRPPLRGGLRSALWYPVLVLLWLVSGVDRAAAAAGWQAPLVPLTVTRAFQPPPTPYAAGHRGVDLGGQPGEEVRSAGSGEVSYAGRLAGRGVVVVVHGVLRTTYEPVTAGVQRGSHVAAGQSIGLLSAGHAGCPVAACLHWGLLRGDSYLDPMSLLSAKAVRLYTPAAIADASAPVAASARTQAALSRDGPTHPTGTLTASSGPSPAAWSLVALSGAGVVMARRRR